MTPAPPGRCVRCRSSPQRGPYSLCCRPGPLAARPGARRCVGRDRGRVAGGAGAHGGHHRQRTTRAPRDRRLRDPGRADVHSHHNGYWYFGARADTGTTLYISTAGRVPDPIAATFTEVTDHGHQADPNDVGGGVHAHCLEGQRESWAEVWLELNALR